MIKELILTMRVRDVIDIIIVAAILYKSLFLLKGTRAEQLIKGIIIIFALTKITEVTQLHTINWILKNIMTFGALAILIVFQPELRRGLEYIGRNKILSTPFVDIKKEQDFEVVNEIITAISSLSRQGIGALIVIEKNTGLNDIAETGTIIDGKVSSELLINIFIPNTPLHDGAVIIKGRNIKSAAAFLPLSDMPNISKGLGTRHRAAIGISERSDSLAIVVSEENGSISTAEDGKISRYVDIKTLRQSLIELYKPKSFNIRRINSWGTKDEKNI